jgi:hypothetical protein
LCDKLPRITGIKGVKATTKSQSEEVKSGIIVLEIGLLTYK